MSSHVTQTSAGPAQQEAEAGGQIGAASLWSDAWGQLRRNPLFVTSALLVLFFIVVAIAPGLFTNADPRAQNLANALQGPSSSAWFGTDRLGRDYFARVIYGARPSITIGLLAAFGSAVVGLVLGTIAAYYGRWRDAVISRVIDIFFALPFLLGAIVVMTVIGNRTVTIVAMVLVLFTWPIKARLMRSSVIAAKEADYVSAARALGASDFRIMFRHLLPNSIAPLVVYTTVSIGLIIAAEATLTFLGVGLRIPAISWGLQLADGRTLLLQHPHLLLFPGIFVFLTIFAFILMGDALRDALDPRLR
jgi:oligopeptide transport system permease protein